MISRGSWTDHLALKQLSLIHNDPKMFTVSQWQFDKSQPHLLYRTFVAAFTLTIWSLRIPSMDSAVHLTMWGFSLFVLQAILAFILVYSSFFFNRTYKGHNVLSSILRLYPFYWIVQVMATSIGFMITVVYWSFLFKDQMLDIMNFFLHGGNTILLLIDLWIVGHPVRILHFVYPLLFGLSYGIFSIVYHFYDLNRGGVGYVYPIQNWSNPVKSTLITLGVGVLLIGLHVITFGIYKVKIFLYRKIYSESINVAEFRPEGREHLSGGT